MRYAIMSLLAFLTACAGSSTTKLPEHQVNGERWATEVFLTNQCVLAEASSPAPAAPIVAAIGAAIVPALIDVSLSAFSQALQNAAKERTTTYGANRTVTLFKRSEEPNPVSGGLSLSTLAIDSRFRCILVIVGRFNTDKKTVGYSNLNIGSDPRPADLTTVSIEKLTEYLQAVGTGLVAAPDLIYEARIDQQANREAFVVSSTFLYAGKFQDGGSSAKRSLAVTIAIDTPAAAKGTSTLRAIPLVFGDLEGGTRLVEGEFGQGERSFLIQGIDASKPAKEVFQLIGSVETQHSVARAELMQVRATVPTEPDEIAAREKKIKGLEAQLAKLAERHRSLAQRLKSFMPVEVNVTVVETKSASRMIKFLADVFEKARPGIDGALKAELDPATRKALKEAEEVAAESLEDSLSTAKIAYLKAKQIWLAGNQDELGLEILREEYVKALRAYNRTRADAGLSPQAD